MGCTGIISFVTEVFEFFKKSYLEDLPEQRRKFVDFSNLIFIGSVLYLCAKSSKFTLEKKRVINEIGCSESDFNGICEVISIKCENLLKETKTSIEIKKMKKKSTKKMKKIENEKIEKENEETLNEVSKIEEINQELSKETECIQTNEEIKDKENSKKRKFEETESEKLKPKKRKQVTLHYFQSNSKQNK